MIRVVIILLLLGLILSAGVWTYRWLVKNRVRLTMHRAPTGREILFFSMILQVLRTVLRLLLRR